MAYQAKLNQESQFVQFFTKTFCLVSLLMLTLAPVDSIMAQSNDSTLAQWTPWNGSAEGLCLAKPLYCGCDGYYKRPELSEDLPPPSEERSFYGVADEYAYSFDGVAELLGDVVIQLDQLQVNAQQMSLNDERQSATFKGEVQLNLPGFRLSGPVAEVSTAQAFASIDQAGLILYKSGLKGTAQRVELSDDTGLRISQGRLSSCTPGHESWMLVGSDIELDVKKGWGTIRHMRIEVADIPVFYVPYFTFPLTDQRQTGFLVPMLDLSEPDLAIPYYINLAPNYDLTLTPRFIGSRGSMLESEFRYLTPFFNGHIHFDRLPVDEQRQAVNLDAQRTRAQWLHTGELAENWDYDLQLDYVSDSDYFVDFDRALDNQTQVFLNRTLNVRYISPNWSFLTRFQGYQVLDESLAPEAYPYRRTPEIQLSHFNRLTNSAPIFWNNRFSYTYFEQPRAVVPNAHRAIWHSILSAPLHYFWGTIEPKVEVHHRRYNLSDSSNESDIRYTIPTASVDTTLALRRNNIYDRYWQTIEPRIFLTFTPYEDQSQIPLFDTSELTLNFDQLFLSNPFIGDDRISDRQQLSLGLTSRVFDDISGRMVLRGDIGQGFVEGDKTPIMTRLVFSPQERLYWTNQANWNIEDSQLSSASSRISYLRPRPVHQGTDAVGIEYRYRREELTLEAINQYELAFAHSLNHQWKLLGKVRYDHRFDRSFEHLAGFTYTGCCWETSIVYHRTIQSDELSANQLSAEHGVLFEIRLKSLGGLGGGLSSFLQQQIPGFQPRGAAPKNGSNNRF